MRLVLDTSVAFQLFSRDSFVRECAVRLELISVPELMDELKQDRIRRFTGATFKQYARILSFIGSLVEFRQPSTQSISKAESLISHKRDAPFLAFALGLHIPLWSNDAHFKEQSVVPVFTVSELKSLLA